MINPYGDQPFRLPGKEGSNGSNPNLIKISTEQKSSEESARPENNRVNILKYFEEIAAAPFP